MLLPQIKSEIDEQWQSYNEWCAVILHPVTIQGFGQWLIDSYTDDDK